MKGQVKVPDIGGAFTRPGKVPPISRPRSVFRMDKNRKHTFATAELVPIWVQEVLPGDTWSVQLNAFLRLVTLINPVMDNAYFQTHFFFVPWRLIWDNARKFFGEQDAPGDSISYTIPQSTPGYLYQRGLADYFGVRPFATGSGKNTVMNTLDHRAYHKIYFDWYRDENLQTAPPMSTGDGPDDLTLPFINTCRLRGKRPDYFTESLPFLQKGAAVTIPAAGNGMATVYSNQQYGGTGVPTFTNSPGTLAARALQYGASTAAGPVNYKSGAGTPTINTDLFWSDPQLVANVSGALGTINQFRQAYAVQVYLEAQARGGTRYVEYLQNIWGVTSSDARLQRSEYLGGGRTPVNVSPVAQTSASPVSPATGTPQGNLAGVGTVSAMGHGFVRSFEEHGVLMCIGSVCADQTYQYGMPRRYMRRTVYDVANPLFANLGDQAVMLDELYYDGGTSSTVWGYQGRYEEYKQDYNDVTSNMRSDLPDSFDLWHWAQEHATAPALNDVFIRADSAGVQRTLASNYIAWMMDMFVKAKVARALPTYGVPGLAGRF